MNKALNEFRASEGLRPIKIVVYQHEAEQYDTILHDLSQHYRIPIITFDSILESVLASEVIFMVFNARVSSKNHYNNL